MTEIITSLRNHFVKEEQSTKLLFIPMISTDNLISTSIEILNINAHHEFTEINVKSLSLLLKQDLIGFLR